MFEEGFHWQNATLFQKQKFGMRVVGGFIIKKLSFNRRWMRVLGTTGRAARMGESPGDHGKVNQKRWLRQTSLISEN